MEEVVTKSFQTSPDTVFGVLVGILVVILIAVGLFLRNMAKTFYENWQKVREEEREEALKKEEQYRQLNTDYIEVLTNVVQGNTMSNNELANELKNHRESGYKIVNTSMKAIESVERAQIAIKDHLLEIKSKLK